MNWIKELCDLYDKNAHLAGKVEVEGTEKTPPILLPLYHSTAAAQITVEIDGKGEFIDAHRVPEADKLTIIPLTDNSGSRTMNLQAHPLCDSLKYVAGDYDTYCKPGKKDFSENYKLYIQGLEAWHLSLHTHEKVDAIYNYVSKGTLIHDLVGRGVLVLDENGKLQEKEKIQNVQQADAFVRFRVLGEIDLDCDYLNNQFEGACFECWLDRSLQQSYIEYHRSVQTKKDFCYLTGEKVPVTYLQPKKIRSESDGAKLISSNDKSNFTFRGRFADATQAFAIGYESSQKATNALKWIIRKQGYNWDGLCVVVWESNLKEVPDWNADTDKLCDHSHDIEGEVVQEDSGGETEPEESRTGETMAVRFKAAMQGYGDNLSVGSKVMLLAFDAATTGRLAMTECRQFESSRYIANIAYWHESCKWLQSKYKDGHRHTFEGVMGVKDIVEALYGTEQGQDSKGKKSPLSMKGRERMYAEVCKRLLPCISEREKIPVDMVNLAIRRASSPLSFSNYYNWEKVLSIACSLVKKQRKERKKEDWKLALNMENKDRSYLYGRLLAVAERVEYRTYDKKEDADRETNARRYMTAFSQHPYGMWKIIEEQIQPYLMKLKRTERDQYNRLLGEILDLFDEEKFANDESLEGLYLLGFHSQAQALRHYTEHKDNAQEENKND